MFYRHFNRPEDQKILLDWWEQLKDNRGERAQLRRCQDPSSAALEKASFRLRQLFPYWDYQPEIIGAMAACLAHVKEEDASATFAAQLAKPGKQGKEPRMSELRFKQLQKVRNWEELFTHLRRAIDLIGNKANLYSLASDIVQWGEEYRPRSGRAKAISNIKYEWAKEYYNQILISEKSK